MHNIRWQVENSRWSESCRFPDYNPAGYSKYIEKFASKYKLYLPTKEELKAEIETQKAMFYLQQQEREDKEIE